MSIKWVSDDVELNRKNHNYMLTEPLGVTTEGCRCQNVFAVLIENGELVEQDQQSYYPVHLREKKEAWIKENLLQRDGIWYQKFKKDDLWEVTDDTDGLISEVIDGVEHVLDGMSVTEVNGRIFEIQSCSEFTNTPWQDDDVFQELPDGIYLILLEHACWTETSWEGYVEGDSDHATALLTSVPITYKDIFTPVQ